MVKKFVNTFYSGIDKDTAVTKYSNSNMFACENMRVISNDELSSGALLSIKGNSYKAGLSGGGFSIKGYCNIREWVVLFINTDSGARIYKFWDSGADAQDDDDKMILMYENVNLQFAYPIRAVGRYENETVQKIYFTDTETFFYHLNIAGETQIDETLVPLGALDLVADINFVTISYEVIPGGNLKAGKIQYAYQLYNVNGSESCYSPTSSLINLTSSDDNLSTTFNYTGSDKGKIINKSVRISINISDSSFDNFTRLRLVAVTYENDNIIPEVRIVGEYRIDGVDTFGTTDTGQSIGSLTLEEFRFIQGDIIPKTLETKNNYLFIGNTSEEFFHISDSDYDARAFRFNLVGDCYLNDWGAPEGTGDYINGDSQGDIESGVADLGLLNDCFCLYNDLDNNTLYGTAPEKAFRFQSDGTTIGGEGINISYEFTSRTVAIDNDVISNGSSYVTKTYGTYIYPYQETKLSEFPLGGYASYTNSAEYVGYNRDEIIPFAIVFYDAKGRQSFAKWIGDIRFPNQTDGFDEATNKFTTLGVSTRPFISYDSPSTTTYANILGIKFTLKSVPSDAVAWQIVRCERDDANKTVKAAGISSYVIDGIRGVNSNLCCYSTIPSVASNADALGGIQEQRIAMTVSGTSSTSVNGNPCVVAENSLAANYFLTKDYAEFSSPEISFYKNIVLSDTDYFECVGALKTRSHTAIEDQRSDDEWRNYCALISDKYRDFTPYIPLDPLGFPSTIAKINTSKIFTQITNSSEPGYATSGGNIYSKRTSSMRNSEYPKHFGLRGTHLFAELETSFADIDGGGFVAASGIDGVMYTYYRQNRARGIYGGTDYSARTGRTYYKASPVIPISTTEKEVYGGDTYIGYMIEYRSLWDDALLQVMDNTSRGREIVTIIMYPVETTINLNLRSDDIQKYIPWTASVDVIGVVGEDTAQQNDNDMPKYQIQERVSQGISLFPKAYPQELGDLYRYNRAYSVMDKSKIFIPEPFDFVETETFDTRIYHSLSKINGEYIDSWLKFLPSNYIEVESEFGEIQRLININGRVICLQNTGVCVLGINDRSLVKDNNPGSITLGTGGILNRYDYVSFTSGIDRHDAAVGSDETLYYVDAKRKRIYMLGEGDVPISAVKGINSQLKQFTYDTIVTGYNTEFSEVFFTIDGTTVVYGEFQKAFIGSHSHSPAIYINGQGYTYVVKNEGEEVPLLANALTTINWDYPDEDFILISDGSAGGEIWKEGTGPDGTFFGGAEGSEAYVELIINPEGKNTCMFSVIDMKMEVIDANGDEVSTEDTTYPHHPVFSTIKKVIFSNSYQTSTVNVLYDNNIKKIAKGWRMQVPLFTDSKYPTRSTRYVDTYLRLKIVFDASTANRLRLHDITTYYTPVQV